MAHRRSRRAGTHRALPPPTLIEFLLDETGSMSAIAPAAITGFNTFLAEQRETPGTCLLSLTKFDSRGLRTPYVDLDVALVPPLTVQTYIPNANTNLRDAILTRIEALRARLAQWDVTPRVLLVALTDGGDNCSRASIETTRGAIGQASAEGWTCVYLGPSALARKVGADLGFADGNIHGFEVAQINHTMQTLSASTTAFRSAATSAGAFFSGMGA